MLFAQTGQRADHTRKMMNKAGHEGKVEGEREGGIKDSKTAAADGGVVARMQLDPELSCWWHELFSVFCLPPLPNMGCN